MGFNTSFNTSFGGGQVNPYEYAAARSPVEYLPEEEKQSLMAMLAGQTGGVIETLGRALDTPGAIARGVLAGKPLSGFSWDYDTRVSGEDLLSAYGLNYDNPYARAFAGFAAEVFTDPLAWLSGPKTAITGAGRAASAAGILDKAQTAAAAKMGYNKAAKTLTGRYTDDALKRMIPELPARAGQPAAAATEGVLDARPLLGPRLSRSMTTLDDVVKMADDPMSAMDKVLDYLRANNLSWQDVKDQNLGGALGFGLPFGPAEMVWNPKGAAPVLDALDWMGQRAAWSAPVRYGSAWFDKRMEGATSVAEQVDMLRKAARTAERGGAGRRIASQYLTQFDELNNAVKGVLGPDGLSSPQGNDMLLRMFENVPTAADRRLMQQVPELANAADSWDKIRKQMIRDAKDLGLQRNEYADRFGVRWSPVHTAEIEFDKASKTGRAALGSMAPESIGREKYLQVPGGRVELREISLLPMVREHAQLGPNSPYSHAEVGEHIREFLRNRYGQDVLNRGNASKQASFFQHMKKDLPSDYPVFAEHPLNAQARSIINHQKNIANTELAYDLLTENAVQSYPSDIQGGGFKALDRAIKETAEKLGLKSGKGGAIDKAVEQQIADRLQARFGTSGPVDLTQWSIPQSVFNRVTRAKKIYESPQAWQDVWGLFEQFTTVFKGFVLAWPSRHVRDAYSNAFSAWLEVGNANDTVQGMWAASKVLAGEWGEVMSYLEQLPKYSRQGLTGDALRREFIKDAGGSGVLATLASSDLLSARQRAAITELVPGASPVKLSQAVGELVPDGSRTLGQQARDFFTIQGVTSDWQTKNPMLNASQKINDANDSIARLGGLMALMKQGVSPDEAATRITAALVDYGSLTDVEKQIFKNVFPWWTYNSRMGTYVTKHMLERPGGRYGQTIRALDALQHPDEDHYVPESLRQRAAIRVPDELLPYLGMEKRGPDSTIDTYISNIDVAGREALETLGLTDQGISVGDTLSNLLQQSHPLLRTTAELAMDRDLWSKRPLSEAVTPLDRIYKKLFQTETRLSPEAKAVVQNLPGVQRLLSLGGGLADERLTPAQRAIKQAINQTTGFAVTSADEDWLRSELLRKIADQLKGTVVHGEYSYIPESLLPEVPERDLKLYQLQKSVQRDQSKSRKRKKEAAAAK
jgi:hypothetical protein